MKLSKIKLANLGHGTNILSLDIPPELEKTVTCGVPFMDDAAGGEGFTPSSVMLFTGTPGAGKTTLMLQVANAITATGGIALFNTDEESPVQVRKVTKRLGCKHGFYIGQDRKTTDIIKHAKALQRKHPGKQLFIIHDSLQCLDDGKYANGHINSMTAVRAVGHVADFCKSTYAIGIIIGQVNKDGQFAGKQMIKHIVDMHGHLEIDLNKKSETFAMRLFEITKNRFGCTGRTYVCDMRRDGLKEIGSFTKGQQSDD